MTSVYPPSAPSLQYNPAVSRSTELLSCAKTALKIAKSRHTKEAEQAALNNRPFPASSNRSNQWFLELNPTDLELHNPQHRRPISSPEQEILEDGLTLLRTMESELTVLEKLVRRRGHTNDPTEEIGIAVQRLERDAKDLTGLIATMVPTSSRGGAQLQRHWKAVQQWFQAAAQQHAAKLKEILQVRGTVLQEQAKRRQRFQPNANSKNSATSKSSSAAASALFAMPPPPPKAPKQQPQQQQQSAPPPSAPSLSNSNNNNATHQPYGTLTTNNRANGASSSAPTSTVTPPQPQGLSSTSKYPYYGNAPSTMAATAGYGGGGYSSAGYGGSRSNASVYAGTSHHHQSTGMRQRRGGNASTTSDDNDPDYQQQQLALRQQERQTAHRLNEAKHAEKSLAELVPVFGKMATLISQQSDVLEKVEDDVEAAMLDVNAGHSEITTLYSLKKGNRALIVKVFGLLIFFIVFMRFYVRK